MAMLTDLLSRRTAQVCEYQKWASLVREQTGKSILTQLREIRALRNYGGQCGISDYYWYRLYDSQYLHGRGARDFLGWRLQSAFSFALNPRNVVLPAWDKCVFSQLASAAGLPIVPIHACFHRAAHISSALGIHLRTSEAVREYLRDGSVYPLFGKPSYSQQGFGSVYLAGYDSASDHLVLLNGKTIQVNEFLKRLESSVDMRYHRPECGFVFQRSLKLSPDIFGITNWSAISGVRIVCLNGPDGVTPIRAIWKIAVPPNHVDNFSLGKYGNLLADINLQSGEISRVLGGFWPGTQLLTTHPNSGQSMIGFKLPGWANILDACKEAGRVFPLMKIHHWDFAITDKGAMILELNDIGATEFLQVHGNGLLTEETRAFLKEHGNVGDNPWIRAL